MPEYIERAKVAEFFEKNNQVMWHKDDIAATVSSKSIPAADVAEVIRCRECIFKQKPKQFGDLQCTILDVPMRNDDFCSYGERKEDVNA